MKRFLYSFFVTLILVVSSVSVAYAQDYGLGKTSAKLGYQAGENIYTLLGRYVGAGLSMIAFVFFGMMLYAGIRWMTARGNEELITKAKDALTAGIIGIIVITASYGLTTFVFSRLGGQATAPATPSQSQAAATMGCCVHTSTADNTVTKCDSLTQTQCTPLANLEQTQWHQGEDCQVEPACKPLSLPQAQAPGACYGGRDICLTQATQDVCAQSPFCQWINDTCVSNEADANAPCTPNKDSTSCIAAGCIWASTAF